MRYHCELLINPLKWTSRHLDLVGCQFEDVGIPPVNTESTQNNHRNNGGPKPCSTPPSDAEEIATNVSPPIKLRSLINILIGEEGPFAYTRVAHRPNYIIFHHREESADDTHKSTPPLVGYVHYTSINEDRRRQFEPCPGPRGVFNSVGANICQKRLAQTTPKEWTEDPYFICHLLALAQFQEFKLDLSEPSTYTSRLLVTNVLDRECMMFYEAQITTELLDGLRDPRDATSPLDWPTVWRKRVSYKPYHTFASRLVAEIVAPSPVLSSDHLGPSDDVKGVIGHGRRRPPEQDSGSSNAVRIPERLSGDS
ncbi:hypothetical protein N7452_009840 [Penicillium brevicompactum]|uniref:Uncharacterized protein n=1 Tax=Penicillium brevicompactum TaxID=5074 RepID=A0A9W9UCP2_PENBR|nr:hypothetical protein N7452_009840 [Penicillium brevicompactum]